MAEDHGRRPLRINFVPADVPLLAMFCRVSVLAAEAVAHLEQDGQLTGAGKFRLG